jgi:hypothetical protein
MKIFNIILPILLLSGAVGGCTKEDLSVCGVDVLFKFDYNMDQKDKFASDIEWVDLFVFDSEGVFVDRFSYRGPFEDHYRVRLNLPAGTYDFIVWGERRDEHYQLTELIQGGTRLSEAQLSLIAGNGGRIENFPSDLYHGSQMGTRVEALGTEVLIPMIKDTNKVQAVIRGLPVSAVTKGDFTCRIEAENGNYNFENSLHGNRKLTYVPQTIADFTPQKSVMTHDFVTMRLIGENGPTTRAAASRPCGSTLIVEYNSTDGKQHIEILNIGLVDAIAAQYGAGVDLDRRDEYVLPFDYSGDYTFENFTITIGDWQHVTGDGGKGGLWW